MASALSPRILFARSAGAPLRQVTSSSPHFEPWPVPHPQLHLLGIAKPFASRYLQREQTKTPSHGQPPCYGQIPSV
ncbi:hypothetical protein I7I50_07433 [Histoplasma capsulatum G186AR]|uniref:Uncharacterized protein n=1 Tax=Ajellomyces capsulatus TaxID=5037 RepID=A0A8H7YVH1_AJECA|nr:hypothetical protein I7I52_09495 [Histoplasma capsulatum]QSS68136.1 hypothetical protein I7I50_07433 [Histoplasma capsulatum G186AR]